MQYAVNIRPAAKYAASLRHRRIVKGTPYLLIWLFIKANFDKIRGTDFIKESPIGLQKISIRLIFDPHPEHSLNHIGGMIELEQMMPRRTFHAAVPFAFSHINLADGNDWTYVLRHPAILG